MSPQQSKCLAGVRCPKGLVRVTAMKRKGMNRIEKELLLDHTVQI